MGFSGLEGKWRMVLVKENITGQSISKPPSITGDVDITIRHTTGNNGIYSGNTPANLIMDNAFSIGDDRTISIPSLGMSKAMETAWGFYFVDNVCFSKEYSLSGSRLHLKTTNLTLIFERI